jgi:DNA-binding NarL/FixJ family response regulator
MVTTDHAVGALIVDDEESMRVLLRMLIERHNEGLFVSGEVDSGPAALEQLEALDPAVVVLDQMMPTLDGLQTAARILAVRPHQRIVLFSAYLDDDLERAARDCGITTCVRKDAVNDLPAMLLEIGRN